MRESFGGAFMLKLVLIFVIIYVSFMAVAFNYAKAFRVKNNIINLLEQYQYNGTATDQFVIEDIDSYLQSVAYTYGSRNGLQNACYNENSNAIFTANGACIIPLGNEESRYYRVVTYIPINFPFFSLEFYVSIVGETKIVSV